MRPAGTQEPAVTHEPLGPRRPQGPSGPAGTRAARVPLSEALALMGEPRQTDEPHEPMVPQGRP
jgi:hypothetical protein